MKIGIDYHSNSVDQQIFDSLYALIQSSTNGYKTDLIINEHTSDGADIKILYAYMPISFNDMDIQKYDFIFIGNGSEGLGVSTEFMKYLVDTYPNVYLLGNSYLNSSHHLKERVIWYGHNVSLCRDYWNRPFYPHFHEHKTKSETITRQNKMLFINGANRTCRLHSMNEILKINPNFPIKNSISQIGSVETLPPCIWESDKDTKFRKFLDLKYDSEYYPNSYYDNSVSVGIEDRFGKIPPGYTIIDEYYENLIIVYPENSCINNELSLTEKILKCFMAKTIPFPIGGVNTNKMYNELGFKTAWNLFPDSLKIYDGIEDHVERYSLLAKAVNWVYDNINDLDYDAIKEIVDENHVRFLNGGSGADLTKLCKLFRLKNEIPIGHRY